MALLLLLEALVRAGFVNGHHLPPPTEIFSALVDRVREPAFADQISQTLQGWGLGLLLACVLAVPIGLAIGCSPIAYRLLHGPIELLRPIPSVAFVPLVVLTLGSGLEAEVFLVAFAAFWPLLVHSIYGVRDLDPLLLETARSLRLGPGARFVRVILPGSLPYVATGLRTASAIALILAITAELVIGSPGLGQAISLAEAGGATASMYALIVVAGAIGWVLNGGLVWFERRLLPWRVGNREPEA